MLLKQYAYYHRRSSPEQAYKINVLQDIGELKTGQILFRWTHNVVYGFHYWDEAGTYLGKDLQPQGLLNTNKYFKYFSQTCVEFKEIENFEIKEE